jgi:hypothetical protein
MNTEYGLKAGFKWFFLIFGGITSLILMGIPVLILGLKASAAVGPDGLQWWWLGQKKIAWDDIAEIKRAPTAGALGGLMAPLSVVRTNGKAANFPVGVFKDSKQIKAQIAEFSGLTVP